MILFLQFNGRALLLKAFKHAVVHLEEREGPPLGGDRLPWWNAALGKGARKHRSHGHGHIKHHKHEDEVRMPPETTGHRTKLASVRRVVLRTECGCLPRLCELWRDHCICLLHAPFCKCSERLGREAVAFGPLE